MKPDDHGGSWNGSSSQNGSSSWNGGCPVESSYGKGKGNKVGVGIFTHPDADRLATDRPPEAHSWMQVIHEI